MNIATRTAARPLTTWPPETAPPATIDAADVMRGVWRRRFMVLALTVVAAALAIVFVVFAEREYTATAQVLVESLETPFDRSQPNDAERRLIDEREISSQVQLLRSRDLSKRVIEKLQLTARPEFDPISKGVGLKKRVLIALGFARDPRKQSPEQRALAVLDTKVKAYQVAESNVIEVEATSRDPKTAAEIADTMADLYVTSTREAQSTTTGRARDWLSEQVEQLRAKVVQSEDAVEAFRSQAGLIKGTTTTLSTQELSELNSQIILAEAAKSEAQAKAKSIRDLLSKTGTVDTSSAVLASALIQRLREQQVALQRQLAELSTTYLAGHPKIVSIKREIDDLNRQVRAEALKVVAGLEQEARIAATREAALRESLNTLKTRAADTNNDEVKLRALEREAAANRTLLESFLARLSDASARQEVVTQPGMARVIAHADVPSEPSYPKTGPVVLLATLAGFTIGLGLAFMAEVMGAAKRLHQPGSEENIVMEPPPLAQRLEKSAMRQAAPAPVESPPAAEAEAPPGPPPLRATLHEQPVPQPPASARVVPIPQPPAPPQAERRQPAPPPPVSEPSQPVVIPALCVAPRTSGGPEPFKETLLAAGDLDGDFARSLKPLVSWCISVRQTLGVRRIAGIAGDGVGMDAAAAITVLARSLAMQNVRTVVIDTDRQSPWLSAMFGTTGGAGLAELVAGEAKFGHVIVRDMASAVHFMRAGVMSRTVDDVTYGERMDRVLEALERSYDVVLLNVGRQSLSVPAERHALAKCQAAVLFARAQQARETSAMLAALSDLGLSAVQHIRLADQTAQRPVFEKVAATA